MILRSPTRHFAPGAILLAAATALAGCASYRAAPLSLKPPLNSSLATLDRHLPDGRTIDTDRPLSPQALAALAVLNDPALAAARAGIGVGRAQTFATGLLPDPNIQGGFGALIGGPGLAPSIAGAISQDLASLVTRGTRLRAAKARAAETRARVMWQEWQVATQAETLAISLWADRRTLVA
ncbi:MAG TPA: transporter, partial [Acidiphilium sp.]